MASDPKITPLQTAPRTPRSNRSWGLSDAELATLPLPWRHDLLKGRTFLISGGGSGLGRAMAYVVARLGANVMICGRRAEKLTETALGIKQHLQLDIGTYAMTIRDPEQVNALVQATVARYGAIHTLVNNGGGQYPQAAIDFSVKGWHAVIDTNLNGSWYMMQACARLWRDTGAKGDIVTVVANVWRGMPQVAHTCAARAAVIYLSKTLATEWAPLGIRVNCISPGSIATEGLNVYEPKAAESFRYTNPMHSLGNGFDIANALIYLSSPDTGQFVTGEVLVVDGGNNQFGNVWPGGVPEYFKRGYRILGDAT
jgi:NAD(P)-dependent dehydrogenase (short-subunit alcohol dehydrogenase family)